MAVPIPAPALVLLVGAAGAGKSTFAGRHFAPETVLSSDELRLVIAGDATDQSRNSAVFRALHRTVATRLERGALVVVDATNVDHQARRPLLAIARRMGAPAVAIVLDLPLATVLARNAARPGRTVDPAVVRRQHARLGRALAADRLAHEGFDRIVRLASVEAIDRIHLIPAGSPAAASGLRSAPGDARDGKRGDGDADRMATRQPLTEERDGEHDRDDRVEG
jgi:protein phosphatase